MIRYFHVLKGQGPAARLGQMDYVIEGVMSGGFALIATPAEYGVTGGQTFIVSYDGVGLPEGSETGLRHARQTNRPLRS